jgi:hypothetical protein
MVAPNCRQANPATMVGVFTRVLPDQFHNNYLTYRGDNDLYRFHRVLAHRHTGDFNVAKKYCDLPAILVQLVCSNAP